MVLCDDDQGKGVHRIGFVTSGCSLPAPSCFSGYSRVALDLGGAPGGDIDPHLFTDPQSNSTFLVWKTDDNNAGGTTTRIWAAPCTIERSGAISVDPKMARVIMDSTGDCVYR